MALPVQFTIARARRIGTYSPREMRAIIRTAQQDRHAVLVQQERARAAAAETMRRDGPPLPTLRLRDGARDQFRKHRRL